MHELAAKHNRPNNDESISILVHLSRNTTNLMVANWFQRRRATTFPAIVWGGRWIAFAAIARFTSSKAVFERPVIRKARYKMQSSSGWQINLNVRAPATRCNQFDNNKSISTSSHCRLFRDHTAEAIDESSLPLLYDL